MNQDRTTGRLAALQSHIGDLRVAYAEARAAGEWDRADLIQLGIDDTRDEIKALGSVA